MNSVGDQLLSDNNFQKTSDPIKTLKEKDKNLEDILLIETTKEEPVETTLDAGDMPESLDDKMLKNSEVSVDNIGVIEEVDGVTKISFPAVPNQGIANGNFFGIEEARDPSVTRGVMSGHVSEQERMNDKILRDVVTESVNAKGTEAPIEEPITEKPEVLEIEEVRLIWYKIPIISYDKF